MEAYKIKIDNDEKNINFKLNGINKKLVQETKKSINNSKMYTSFDDKVYQDSLVGNRISRLQNNNTRINHMVKNKGIAFSSLVE